MTQPPKYITRKSKQSRPKVPKQRPKLSIQVGPFADAANNIYDLGASLYMSYLYEQTVSELLSAQRELTAALETRSEDPEIEMLQERVIFLESVVTLATKNYDNSFESSGAEH